MNFNSRDEAHREALIRYSLLEESQVKHKGIILLSEGKAAIRFREEDIEILRPEKKPLNIKLEVLLKGDVLSKVKAEDVVILLERLQENLVSGKPEIIQTALETLQDIEDIIPGKH
jgi:hypothetical protein